VRKFPYPKHHRASAPYKIRWQEPLAGAPVITVQPQQPSNPTPLVISGAGLSDDGFSVVFRASGGDPGSAWELEVVVQTPDGSTLVEDVLLGIV
jgi:hypothetical protein